jgi:DNA-binding MarR family transcriptional regulator
MRLTVYTDYALRLLMYLAVKDNGLATIADVAKSYGISKNHLMKVAHQLGQAGYVGTVRRRVPRRAGRLFARRSGEAAQRLAPPAGDRRATSSPRPAAGAAGRVTFIAAEYWP